MSLGFHIALRLRRSTLQGLRASLVCFLGSILLQNVAFSGLIVTNFKGTDLNAQFAQGGGAIPPDTMGAVGPSHIVESINRSFAIYDKSGGLQTRTTLNSFWNTAFTNAGQATTTTSSFDPRILYDQFSGRWYAVAADNSNSANSRILVAVTTGSDPSAANWRGYTIDPDTANTRWADFPTVGLDASGLYIGNNMFDAPGGAAESVTTTFIGIPKASLVAGNINGFKVQENIVPNLTGFTMQPVVDLDNSALPNKVLSAFNKSTGALKTSSIPTDYFTAGTLDTVGGFITVASRNGPPLAQTVGSPPSTLVNTGDSRFSGNVVMQNGRIWAVHSVDVNGRSALEWYEIDAVSNLVIQSNLISDPLLSLYFPSIAVNDFGDVVIGFSGSDNLTPISTYFVSGVTSSGTTSFGPLTRTQLGNGTYQRLDGTGRNRWGDYNATVIDPNDERLFWTFQEYVDGNDNWAIRITSISTAVPEPSSMALCFVVLLGSLSKRRRTR